MDVKKIPQHIKDDLIARGHTEEDMAKMSAERAFAEFCAWNGMYDWAPVLSDALDALRTAAKPEIPDLTIPKAASLGPATERDLQVAKAVHDAVMALLAMPHPLPFKDLRECIEFMPLAQIVENGVK